jgi:hypothetical protein
MVWSNYFHKFFSFLEKNYKIKGESKVFFLLVRTCKSTQLSAEKKKSHKKTPQNDLRTELNEGCLVSP